MPTYEYRCEQCGEVREAIRPMVDSDKDIRMVCVLRPLTSHEIAAGMTDDDRAHCTFKRILSPTTTTFRFADARATKK